MEQLSFVDVEVQHKRKTRKTRLERLTERLEKLIPWEELLELIRPHYFVFGHRGRQPYDLELMLRIHLGQITYNLSDPQMEDYLQENFTIRKFVRLGMSDRTPDETTILQFRHIWEEHDLGTKIFNRVNTNISNAGLHLVKGRMVDASFIEVPSSTKKKQNGKDPEMASGKKAQIWHFGMKMHVATDEVVGIATNVGLKTMSAGSVIRKNERFKASVRSKVEHVFKRIKLEMGYSKTRYRGIKKNAHRNHSLLAVANLFCFDCWCNRQRPYCV